MTFGWLKVHRQIVENDYLWHGEPFSKGQAWIDLLIAAEIADRYSHKYRVTIKRGQLIITIRNLAKRWSWSKSKTFDFLNSLQSAAMLKIEADTKRTVLTIANYEKYQDTENTERTTSGHEADTERTPTILNKNKRSKEVYIEGETPTPIKRFIIPSVDEVSAYCVERKNNIDPQRFIDFYTSNGWKVGKNPMKDWKAAVRTWEKRENGTQGSKPPVERLRPDTYI